MITKIQKKQIECKVCKTLFAISRSRIGIKKYCSKQCYSISQITKVINKCDNCKKKFSCFKSRSKYGRGIFCSKKCQYGSITGNKCHLWKGGITPEYKKIRTCKEYKLWRKSVFERDSYTCQECGIKSKKGTKVTLNADHLKPFAFFPELRFAIDNGRTLCVPCHKATDTYGEKAKKYNQ